MASAFYYQMGLFDAYLDVENIEFTDKGMIIFLLQSKTSDKKQNIYVSFAKDKEICPVNSLKDWIEKAEIKEGAVFRSLLSRRKSLHQNAGCSQAYDY